MGRIMYLIALLLSAFLLVGCATQRDSVTQTEQKDSVRVEYKESIVYVPDTVYVEIPAQQAERTTPDSVSKLENDYAKSEARINADGTLYHNLLAKPQKKPVVVQKPVKTKERLVYKNRYITKNNPKYIEKELSWWQQTQIYGFWVAIIVVLIIYRKKIFQAVVRLFSII